MEIKSKLDDQLIYQISIILFFSNDKNDSIKFSNNF